MEDLMDTKWVKDSFDKGKLEVLKFAKTSKIKIEITSLNKKKDERIKLLGSKVLELVNEGKLDADLFEPDFSYIKNIDEEIEEKEQELEEASNQQYEPEQEENSEEDVDLVNIESQKVLTASSIAVPPEENENPEEKSEEEKTVKKDYTI